MNPIPFWKMSGSGNDFIVIDNRGGLVPRERMRQLVVGACRRRRSVGADGVIFIASSDRADFKWHFFNADGSRPGMCGNGARCAARYAFLQGIAGPRMAFETRAGLIHADVRGEAVKLGMTDPTGFKSECRLDLDGKTVSASCIDTGVPHAVVPVEEIASLDVVATGRRIRHHRAFAPRGTNVNFVAVASDGAITLRTYERGVEDETLACGTGAVATALVLAHNRRMPPPITLRTWGGGRLTVDFTRRRHRFRNVSLQGDARIIYRAELDEEAWQS